MSYTPTGAPGNKAPLASSAIRAEFALIAAAFASIPDAGMLGAGAIPISNGTTFVAATAINGLPVGNITPASGTFTSIGMGSQTRNQAVLRTIELRTSDDPVDNARSAITFGTTAGGSSSNSTIGFVTNDQTAGRATRMHIDPVGKVGIGTTTPATLLHVYGGSGSIDTRATIGNNVQTVQLGVNASNAGVLALSGSGAVEIYSNSVLRGSFPAAGGLTVPGVGTFNTSGAIGTLALTDTGSNGVNIKLTGNGAATPAKYIRVFSGALEITDSSYTTVLMRLTDAGVLTAAGLVGPLTGNASSATQLLNARTINGVSFNGTADITVPATDSTKMPLTGGTFTGGAVAISPASGNASLSVNRATQATGQVSLYLGGGTGGIYWQVYQQASSDNLNFYNSGLNSNILSMNGATGASTFAGSLTAAGGFIGSLTGNVTGNVTGSAGSATGNAATATALQTARLINGVSFNGTADISISAVASGSSLTGTSLAANIVSSSLTSVGTLTALNVTGIITATGGFNGPLTGNVTGNISGSAGTATGNAGSATVLQTARTINGVSFNGSANITVAAAAGTLTGATLAAGVTTSSLTSLGTLTGLNVVTSGSAGSIDITDTGVNGANLVLRGNGVSTPNKYLRATSGAFQVINDAYSAAILTLTDAGALTALGGYSGGAALTSASTVNGSTIGYRGLPSASVTTGAFGAADAGKCVYASGGVTIPNSTMAAGDAVTIINNTGSAITLTASLSTLYQSGTTNTGNRTLAARGMATVVFASSTVGYISGAGLT